MMQGGAEIVGTIIRVDWINISIFVMLATLERLFQ